MEGFKSVSRKNEDPLDRDGPPSGGGPQREREKKSRGLGQKKLRWDQVIEKKRGERSPKKGGVPRSKNGRAVPKHWSGRKKRRAAPGLKPALGNRKEKKRQDRRNRSGINKSVMGQHWEEDYTTCFSRRERGRPEAHSPTRPYHTVRGKGGTKPPPTATRPAPQEKRKKRKGDDAGRDEDFSYRSKKNALRENKNSLTPARVRRTSRREKKKPPATLAGPARG